MSDRVQAPDARPAHLVIQGRLKPGSDTIYERYLEGTRPLLAKYGAEILVVGEGVPSPHTTGTWPVNALVRFPSLAAAEAFLGDHDYLELKAHYRDPAYETLHLSIFLGRPPRGPVPAG